MTWLASRAILSAYCGSAAQRPASPPSVGATPRWSDDSGRKLSASSIRLSWPGVSAPALRAKASSLPMWARTPSWALGKLTPAPGSPELEGAYVRYVSEPDVNR